MARRTKNRLERRENLIEIAENLFIDRGYDKTAVSDIVRAAGVAQGTFYYHFKSKNDILAAVARRYVDSVQMDLEEILEQEAVDPVVQTTAMVNRLLRVRKDKGRLLEYLHQEGNAVLHARITATFLGAMMPAVARAIEKGIAGGRFQVSFPEETAELLVAALSHFIHLPEIKGEFRQGRLRSTLERMVAVMLGLQENEIRLARLPE